MNTTMAALSPERRARRAALLNYFSLLSSFSTLLCCALPSVLVLLGMRATVASLLSAAPWLVDLSRHKIWTFTISGILISASFVMSYIVAPRLQDGHACEADDPTTCGEVSKLSRIVLWGSAVIWSGGFSSLTSSAPYSKGWTARQRKTRAGSARL